MGDEFKSLLLNKFSIAAPACILIHSDITRGLSVEGDRSNRNAFIEKHCEHIADLFPNSRVYMPAFNYDFLKCGSFDVERDPSQVGVLSEYFRLHHALWRTHDPVFSFSGTGNIGFRDPVGHDAIIDPFGANSFFDFLYREDCFLFHYGSRFECSTVLHYAERMSGVLMYRYDKVFKGNVTTKDLVAPVVYRYHVKPSDRGFQYDYTRMIQGLTDANILTTLQDGRTRISYCSLRLLVEYLIQEMRKDPFALLHPGTTSWLQPMVERLGRPLLITDFENAHGPAFEV